MKYPVYNPSIGSREKEYVNDCLDSGWISSRGKYVEKFEKAFVEYTGAIAATSVGNGTVALHLAMIALGIKSGDEVIVPTFTYVASVNAIEYVGATPVFVDCDPETWQISPKAIEAAITDKTAAIMVVHLYGHPAKMDEICDIAENYNLKIIEDAAEAFGTLFKGQHVGTFGDVGTFSFFGNKTITTGEGGMVTTKHENILQEMRLLKSQYVSPTKQYWHEKVGYNFRMTNIEAAIGLAQIERADETIARKRSIAELYKAEFENSGLLFHKEADDTRHSYWMVSILVPSGIVVSDLAEYLKKNGVETRPLFYPVHTMPMFAHLDSSKNSFPISDKISAAGLNLPSWPGLEDKDVRDIARIVKDFIATKGSK